MWALGTTETLIIEVIKEKQRNMKRREYKINRYEKLSTGKMKKSIAR